MGAAFVCLRDGPTLRYPDEVRVKVMAGLIREHCDLGVVNRTVGGSLTVAVRLILGIIVIVVRRIVVRGTRTTSETDCANEPCGYRENSASRLI